MIAKPLRGEDRTPERLWQHFLIEKALAQRLKDASKAARRHLYSEVYDELYKRIPDHPQFVQKVSPEQVAGSISRQMGFLRRFLRYDTTFMEIGPGDYTLSFEVARQVSKVIAIDVSSEFIKGTVLPDNFQLIISDGCEIPLPPDTVSVAYSNQLMEHLHPEDAFEQLTNIYRSLQPGGIYVCITPNRLNGPWDISMYFDQIASGFHLKEYTTVELVKLFKLVGLSKVTAWIGGRGTYMPIPILLIALVEKLLAALPYSIRFRLSRALPLRTLLGIRITAIKGLGLNSDNTTNHVAWMNQSISKSIRKNEILRGYHAEMFGQGAERKRFLDLSCGTRMDVKGIVEGLGHDWVGFDQIDHPGIVKGDAHLLPFQDSTFDVVYSAATFEHYYDPWTVAQEVKRVLKPGGIFCGLIAFLQPWHESYYHFSHAATNQLLDEVHFDILDIRPGDIDGPSYLIQQMFPPPIQIIGKLLSVYCTLIFRIRRLFLRLIVRTLFWRNEAERNMKLNFLKTDELRFAASIIFLARKR